MAADAVEKYVDTKMLVTMVVVFLIIVILVVAYQKFTTPMPPSGSLSPADYDKLSAADKAGWKLDPAGSGFYVKTS